MLASRALFTFTITSTLLLASCRRPQPDPGSEKTSLTFGGIERTYVYHEPSSAPAAGTRTLIISLHGNMGTGAQQEDLTGFSTLADERGFIAVYPDGVDKSWADGRGTTDADTQGIDDVGFISALIDEMVSKRGVDPKKVFVTGFSNGSMMTNRLGCELSDKIAAIGTLSGTMPETISTTCAPKRGVPLMSFHGDADPFAPYGGGEVNSSSGGKVLSAEATRALWAEKSGCDATTTSAPIADTVTDDETTVMREDNQGCKDGSEVVLFTVAGGGHTWPSSDANLTKALVGKSNEDVKASELLIDFFGKHALP